MRTFTFSLEAVKNGGKITAFNYSHSLNELVGSWSATVAGGTFKAGNSISFDNVMENGIITSAFKDSDGLWHVEGKDAGVKLMKSTPEVSELPEGSAQTVINYLAGFCGIQLQMSSQGLLGCNVRSLISGSTCAEAVLELAMLSGCIAYINHSGTLVVSPPSNSNPHFETVLDDSGSDIDVDGYATQAVVLLNYKNYDDEEEEQQEEITGTTPSRHPEAETVSGTFDNGNYSITMLQPFNVIKKVRTSVTENGVTITTTEEHDYDYKSKVLWRDKQEFVLFAFIEREYTLTRKYEGQYHGTVQYDRNGVTVVSINPTFSETTTETMTRSMSASDAEIGVPEDWLEEIKLVGREIIERSTSRTGVRPPDDNMPAYSPPFDSKITRTFHSEDRGKGLLCNETEQTYEARQVGAVAPVKMYDENVPHFLQESQLAIQTHSVPKWVKVKTFRTYYEQYDEDGQCLLSTRSEYSDDGAEWLISNGFSSTGDDTADDFQVAYSAFSQNSKGLDVSVGSSVIPAAWHFMELPGRVKKMPDDPEDISMLGNIEDWYVNGEYAKLSVCPHYNNETKSCNVYTFSDSSRTGCARTKGTFQWRNCERALQALEQARKLDESLLDVPVIGTASVSGGRSKRPAVGYQKEFYIDDKLEKNVLQTLADTIADNILTVKGLKGLRKTVTIPYSPDYQPDGTILEVSHDWQNLTTSVTYKDSGDIPECLIPQSVATIAAFVSARESARHNFPQYGVVLSVDDNNSRNCSVKIDGSEIPCRTKLTNLKKDDIVLVVSPAGNKLRGQVIARL